MLGEMTKDGPGRIARSSIPAFRAGDPGSNPGRGKGLGGAQFSLCVLPILVTPCLQKSAPRFCPANRQDLTTTDLSSVMLINSRIAGRGWESNPRPPGLCTAHGPQPGVLPLHHRGRLRRFGEFMTTYLTVRGRTGLQRDQFSERRRCTTMGNRSNRHFIVQLLKKRHEGILVEERERQAPRISVR